MNEKDDFLVGGIEPDKIHWVVKLFLLGVVVFVFTLIGLAIISVVIAIRQLLIWVGVI